MPAAIFKAEIDFSGGASFDPALVLDDPATPLDFSVLGTAAADVVDITNLVTQCYIRRAFNRSSDAFTGGTARIVFVDETGEYNPANTSSSLYGKIKPMRKIRFTAEYLGTSYNLGSFYIQEQVVCVIFLQPQPQLYRQMMAHHDHYYLPARL